MAGTRAKAVGLGLALFTGQLHAADVPAGRPAPPALLPPALRAAAWTAAPLGDADAIWLPSRKPTVPAATMPPVVTAAQRGTTPNVVTPVRAVTEPVAPQSPAGPRTSSSESAYGPLPEIPAIPVAAAPPDVLPGPRPVPEVSQAWRPVPDSFPFTSPVAADPPPARPMPVPPASDPLPPPREAGPRVQPPAESGTREPAPNLPAGVAEREIPVAPPELMIPAGVRVPGKHGTFGSPPVSISKDYPPLREMIGHDGDSRWPHLRDRDAAGSEALDRLSFAAEYLLWRVNDQQIPVLATTSANGGFGFLGDPGTRPLLGSGAFGGGARSGLRVRAGMWVDDCGTCGFDAGYFFLGRQAKSETFDSGTFPTIARPIFAPNFNAEFGEIVALPGSARGTLVVDSTSSLWGFDANVKHAFAKTCDFRASVFAGYRFLALDEGLRVTEFITALPGNTNDPAGTRVVVQDRFDTRNRFNGGQLGVAAERNWGRISLDGRASVALGNTHQTLDIAGSQARLRPGMATPDRFAGGLLATGPNLGRFERDRFSVVPEATVNLGYWVTPKLKAYVGYNFLYWSNVIRPGDQIDRVVDVTLVPNPPAGVASSGQTRPQPTFRQSDLVVNGIQFGAEWRW